MMDETFLTTEAVLAYLQVNLRTVYRLIKAGKIPAVRVGRQWRVRKRDLDGWLDSQTQAPRVNGHSAPRAGNAHAAQSSGRRRVLVVDDEEGVRDLLTKTLALVECDVETTSGGRDALQRMRTNPYDLLIADLRTKDMDGLAVIREARRYNAGLPVIIITGIS